MRKLVPLTVATQALAAAAATFVDCETIPLDAAKGCVLASDLMAPTDMPEASTALRAGFALRAADTLDASSLSPLPLTASPCPIAAGASLPPGTDAILPAHGFRRAPTGLEVIGAVAPWEDVRRRGEDARRGEILVSAGSVLSPVRLAALSALGIGDVQVRRPRAALRLSAADAAARMMRQLIEASGGMIVPVCERPAVVIAQSNDEASGDAIALQPGLGEAGFRACREGPAHVILPVRPEAVLAIAFALIIPLIDHLTGRRDRRPALTLPLSAKIAVSPGIANAVLLKRVSEHWLPLAAADLPLCAVVAADAIAVLDPACEGLAPGAPLTGLLLAA
jgi:molybdopterin molybdotransferase